MTDNEPAGLNRSSAHRTILQGNTTKEDLVLVDQHTAHERVRFEALMRKVDAHAVDSQLLLAPVLIALPPRLLPLPESKTEALAALGFEVEAFGGGSARLRAVPGVLGSRDPGAALEGILRDLLERESSDWIVSGPEERLAATVACHSAVRAGEALARETMAAVVRDLGQTEHPTLCPHGRPTVVRIPREDVSRWFGRKGWRRE